MPKPVLGRDLGTLLGSNPKESAPAPGAGVRSLMRGNKPEAQVEPEAKPAPEIVVVAPMPSAAGAKPAVAAPKPMIPRWYLFAGDVLLVGLALLTILKSPHPLSWQRSVFCCVLVVLAAALAVLALLTPEPAATSRAGAGVTAKREPPK